MNRRALAMILKSPVKLVDRPWSATWRNAARRKKKNLFVRFNRDATFALKNAHRLMDREFFMGFLRVLVRAANTTGFPDLRNDFEGRD